MVTSPQPCKLLLSPRIQVYKTPALTSTCDAGDFKCVSSSSAIAVPHSYSNTSGTARSPTPAALAKRYPKKLEKRPPRLLVPVNGPVHWEWVVDANLLYWPVVTVPGAPDQLCDATVATRTMDPTISGRPNTFVVNENTTLTSPTVYFQASLSVTSPYVDTRVYTVFSQNATDISSYCPTAGPGWTSGMGSLHTMNYADLNYPVPARAYTCQPKCLNTSTTLVESMVNVTWSDGGYSGEYRSATPLTPYQFRENGRRSTIWDDYAPGLQLPFLDNEKGGHFNTPLLYFDPPKALTSVSSAAGVTTPVKSHDTATQGTPTTTIAQPADNANGPTPTATSTAESTAQAESTTDASSTVSSAGDFALPQPETRAISGPSSSGTSSMTGQPTSSGTQATGSMWDPPNHSATLSTGGLRSTLPSVAASTSTLRGIGDIIAGILGMSKASASDIPSVTTGGGRSIQTMSSSISATETTSYIGGEPESTSFAFDSLGTANVDPADMIAP
ncbi:hypothetical protein LTR56_008206 [Elasticomyces elasticus]|nr:hypothetical protein LTR56_008206 [Elasticomyces elasticus]KAK3661771.1 hypothetical protein LTR22_007352 [Elasticomyces elasticus]KAK4924376.1 hypothetical protein LTR49_008465 [Elasticomyces elasticus]KAK5762660.1 hypothetical protein LTS12_007252 [Elasticomyces elasticus]